VAAIINHIHKMIEEGVINDTKNGLLLVDQSDGDADEGESMDEIGCAIDRINTKGRRIG